MIKCEECGEVRRIKEYEYNSRNIPPKYHTVCLTCRHMPLPERIAQREKAARVQASTVSKMAGVYKPDAWHIRKGSDAFLQIRSIG